MTLKAFSICSRLIPRACASLSDCALDIDVNGLVSEREKEDIHEICPLDLLLEGFHLAPQIRREHFKYPSVGVLVCQRPGGTEHGDERVAWGTYQSKSKTMSCFCTDGSMSCG